MRPRQFSDAELYVTARRCLLEHGADVSTTVIAEQLGVSPAALFKRVGSKDELLLRALAAPAPDWFDDLAAGPDARPVREQLLDLARRVDAYLAEAGPAFAVMRAAGPKLLERMVCPHEAAPVQGHRLMTAWFRALHEQGRARIDDPANAALVFGGALEARHMMRHAVGLDYPDGGPNYVEALVDLIVRAIEADHPPLPAAPARRSPARRNKT